MKHDRQCTVDFSLFYLGFDPIKICTLVLVKPIHSQCIELNCLFMSIQSVLGLIILCIFRPKFNSMLPESHTIVDITPLSKNL